MITVSASIAKQTLKFIVDACMIDMQIPIYLCLPCISCYYLLTFPVLKSLSQVEDVLLKFQRLDKAKDCNWKLEDSNNHKYLPRKKVVKKTVTRRNPAAKKV